jgi:hypothetical protein
MDGDKWSVFSKVTPDDGQIKAETYVGYSENLFISAFVGWMSEYL